MQTPTTPGAIPATPTRATQATDGDLAITDFTNPFKNPKVFTFEGSDRFEEGKVFVQRFEGIGRTHKLKAVREAFKEVAQPSELHNDAIYQAMLLLTDGAAVDLVQSLLPNRSLLARRLPLQPPEPDREVGSSPTDRAPPPGLVH